MVACKLDLSIRNIGCHYSLVPLPVTKPLSMKSCPAGQALNTGKDGKNGKLTKCALVPKLRLSKKLKSNSSAKSAGIENGKSGLTVIATSIVGTHTLPYGAAKLGPSTNVAKEAGQARRGKRRVSTTALKASIEVAAEAARKAIKEVAKVVAREL